MVFEIRLDIQLRKQQKSQVPLCSERNATEHHSEYLDQPTALVCLETLKRLAGA
jgi:hypothetical protein